MALMLAEERVALWLLPAKPADPAKITITEIEAGENLSDRVFGDGTYLRPTASETVNRPLLCGGNSQGLGRSNHEGQIDVARFLDSGGHAIEEEDLLWDATRVKGTECWFAWRVGPKWDAPAAAKDEISVFQTMTDNPQDPQSFNDYVEKIVPVAITQAWLNQVLSA